MRPIETLLIVVNLLTFCVFVVSLLSTRRWMRYLAPSVILLLGAQMLVEGARWQMAPAYVCTGGFLLVWLLQSNPFVGRTAEQKPAHRRFSGLGVGCSILGLAVSIGVPILLPVFHFAHPGGPYAIGTLTYHWIDANRSEIFAADPRARRELMVQIWYPAKRVQASPPAPYVQDAATLTAAFARIHHKPEFLFGNIAYITSDAIPSAPVADDKPSYPVLLFLEGSTGFRQMNMFQVEDLVSHGYIVAALDQPYTAAVVVFPDGHQADGLSVTELQALIRPSYIPVEQAPILNGSALKDGSIIPYLAQDVIFTLNQLTALNQADPNGILTEHLDVQHIGAFGVSLGGIVVGEACRLELRLQACLVMDAPMPTDVVQAGLQQPSMWITRDAETMRLERQRTGGWPEAEIYAHQTTMRAVFKHLPGDGYFVQVPGMFHSNLTDIPSWSPLFPLLGVAGPIDVQRAHSIINGYSLAFFDRHLKRQPATRFDSVVEQYPDVRFETRQP